MCMICGGVVEATLIVTLISAFSVHIKRAWYWLKDCDGQQDCEGTDLSPNGGNGTVDGDDFAKFGNEWGQSTSWNYPDDEFTSIYEEAASMIVGEVATAELTKGRCLVFGAGEGRLAHEIAKISDFDIIGVEQDTADVGKGRAILYALDYYGDGIILQSRSLSNLGYRDYAAVLVVSDSGVALPILSFPFQSII